MFLSGGYETEELGNSGQSEVVVKLLRESYEN